MNDESTTFKSLNGYGHGCHKMLACVYSLQAGYFLTHGSIESAHNDVTYGRIENMIESIRLLWVPLNLIKQFGLDITGWWYSVRPRCAPNEIDLFINRQARADCISAVSVYIFVSLAPFRDWWGLCWRINSSLSAYSNPLYMNYIGNVNRCTLLKCSRYVTLHIALNIHAP